MVMQEDTEIYQEKALRPAGGESLYYLAPKCLYRGEYKRGMKCVALLRVCSCVVMSPSSIPESLLL